MYPADHDLNLFIKKTPHIFNISENPEKTRQTICTPKKWSNFSKALYTCWCRRPSDRQTIGAAGESTTPHFHTLINVVGFRSKLNHTVLDGGYLWYKVV